MTMTMSQWRTNEQLRKQAQALLDAEARSFAAYLQSLPPQTVVGARKQHRSCPIARHLQAGGLAHADVGVMEIDLDSTDEDSPVLHSEDDYPLWVQSFVLLLDSGDPDRPATPALCLELLARAVAGERHDEEKDAADDGQDKEEE